MAKRSKGIECRGIHVNKHLSDNRTTNLNYHVWERLLPEAYEQREFILTGIKDGFNVIDPDCVFHSAETDNYTSATAEKVRAQVEAQISTKIQNGRCKIVDRKPSIILSLGAIPKRSQIKCALFTKRASQRVRLSMIMQLLTIFNTSQYKTLWIK